MATTSKKAKTASDNDDFETVKRYILDCPHVTPEHPAIKAALEGIEKELARRERDAKLARKFAVAGTVGTSAASGTNSSATSNNLSESMVVVERAGVPSSAQSNDSDEMLEWQDVSEKSKDDGEEETDGSSFLGKKLAKTAIDSIAQYQLKVKSPLTAIAAVLHASLRSDTLGFSCTGIPDGAKLSGFAAPVRELPKSVFLPPKWDASPNKIALRYRKDGTGATVLTVEVDANQCIKISFQPAANKEPASQSLAFAVAEHINLDSWNAALKVSPSISPALHYKGLTVLISNFCRTFDLGAVGEVSQLVDAAPYVDNTVPSQIPGESHFVKSDFVSPTNAVPAIAAGEMRRKPWQDGVPATLDQAFPGIRPQPHGDFHADIAPGGLVDPRFMGGPGGRMPGGNQMGPNHPMFNGGGIHGPPLGGPGSMQPRFDPFHPPGIDVDIDGRPRQNRPSRSGVPNPDHLPPPNSFNSNMYM